MGRLPRKNKGCGWLSFSHARIQPLRAWRFKKCIDVGSRPYGQNSWDGKPAAVASVSIGNICGFGANHHLRQSLVFVNVPTMAQPEAYIGGATELFDDSGNLTTESTREFLTGFMQAFAAWVAQFQKK